MIDPELEHKLESCQQILKYWQHFRNFLMACNDPNRVFTPQEEAQFLRLKSEIAILFDSFMEAIEQGNRETSATAQTIITIVQSCILLRQMQRINSAERRKWEIEWHEAYMLMNQTLALLEEEQTHLASVSQSDLRKEKFNKQLRAWQGFVKQSKGLQIGLGVVVALFFLLVVPSLGLFGISWDKMDENSSLRPLNDFRKKVLRDTFSPNIEYRDWNVFTESNPVQIAAGFDKGGSGGGPAESDANKLLTLVSDPPPTLLGKEGQTFQMKAQASSNYSLSVMLFKTSAEAMKICPGSEWPKNNEREYEEKPIDPTIGLKAGIKEPEVFCVFVWRKANAIFVIHASSASMLKTLRSSARY